MFDLFNLFVFGFFYVVKVVIGWFFVGMFVFEKIYGIRGVVSEVLCGKDMLFGYWEIVGMLVMFDWGYFFVEGDVFLEKLVNCICKVVELLGIFGNCYVFGMDIIKWLGEEYICIGKLICYIFLDFVF